MATYLADSRGLDDRALQLYVWNAALAGAFLPAIGAVEVALRNAISATLAGTFSTTWYDDPRFLALDRAAFSPGITRAKQHIAAAGKSVNPSSVVAQLTFGFWVRLLRPAYARTLWPVVRPAFVRYTRRSRVTEAFDPLVGFRNRIAHHHAVYDRDPHVMYDRVLTGARLLSARLADWIEYHSRIPQLLSGGPMPPKTWF